MKFGSLFSGIGGFDLGFERTGIQCAWQVERDPHCLKLLERRFTNAKRYDDVRTVGKHNLESVDILCGGFPCQDVSIAGRRAGLTGERSGLWFEFARIIDELEPRWVVIENVPGLLSSNRGRDFAVIVQWLVKRGYGVCWRVLDAQYFGVAQRRRRVFIVASFGNGRAAEVLFEREGVSRGSAPRREAGKEIAGTLGERAETGWDNQRFRIHDANGIAPTLSQSDGKGGQRTINIAITKTLTQNYGKQPDNSNSSTPGNFVIDVAAPIVSRIGKGAFTDPVNDNIIAFAWQQGATEKGRERIVRTGNYAGSVSANRVDAVSSPSIGVRRLTPTECERLQGFPDGWTDWQSDSTRYRQLGNAVAVPVAEWIANRIKQIA